MSPAPCPKNTVMWPVLRYYIVIQRYFLIFLSFLILFFIPCQGSSGMLILFNGYHSCLQDSRNYHNQLQTAWPKHQIPIQKWNSLQWILSIQLYILSLTPTSLTPRSPLYFKKAQLVRSVAQDVCHMKPLHLKQSTQERMGQNFVCHFLFLTG